MRHHVRGAALLSHVGAEMQLRLPAGGSSSFGAMLRDLDARSEELGVTSYGLGVTTLEEVTGASPCPLRLSLPSFDLLYYHQLASSPPVLARMHLSLLGMAC